MASPINSLEWWNKFFEKQWEDNRGREQTRHFMSELVRYLPSREHRWLSSQTRTVLDWGCALGEGVDVLQAEFPDCEVTGLDFSPVAVEKARAAFPRHRFLHSEDGTIAAEYDVIVTSNCLEHYADPFELAARHIRHARSLYVAMVPFEEPEPIDDTHLRVFTLHSFPESIGVFRKLSVTVFRPLPRYWNAPQAIVCYAGAGYPE